MAGETSLTANGVMDGLPHRCVRVSVMGRGRDCEENMPTFRVVCCAQWHNWAVPVVNNTNVINK